MSVGEADLLADLLSDHFGEADLSVGEAVG